MHESVNLETIPNLSSKMVAQFSRWFYGLCTAPLNTNISKEKKTQTNQNTGTT